MNSKRQSPLNFSHAYKLAGYETVNDEILREMNARAQQVMGQPSNNNPMRGLQRDPSLQPSRPIAVPRPRSPQNRYSAAHRREFQRSAPIAPPVLRPPQSIKKKGGVLESPSKRMRSEEQPASLHQPRPLSNSIVAGAALASRQRQRSPSRSPVRQHRPAQHNLSTTPLELPSYMRPTQASLRRSTSNSQGSPTKPSMAPLPFSSRIPRSTSMRSVSSPLPARSPLERSNK